jgi:hypothetical protein
MKHGNPNFTHPGAIELSRDLPTSFEKVVEELRLDPSGYATSLTLRDWVSRNKDQKYVPSDLLKAFGFEASGDL